VEIETRLLAAARVVTRCWRERRKPRPAADRLRSAAWHPPEAVAVSPVRRARSMDGETLAISS